MNSLARELVGNAGGTVRGERYMPLEEMAVDRLASSGHLQFRALVT
nr:hypothetical protein [uncultured Agrobacterium sp.]